MHAGLPCGCELLSSGLCLQVRLAKINLARVALSSLLYFDAQRLNATVLQLERHLKHMPTCAPLQSAQGHTKPGMRTA